MQNLSQTRVVDAILTTHAQGYQRPGNVGPLLFPRVSVGAYGGNVIQFSKESFRLLNIVRAPGSRTTRVEFGYAGVPYAITPKSLEGVVPFERMRDASQVPNIDLARVAVDSTMDIVELGYENDCATLARTAANYDAGHKATLAGAALWSAGTGNPTSDVEAGVEAIRASIGMRPNTVILSATAFKNARTNPNIIDRYKYTGRDSITTQMLAALWNVQTVAVGEAVSASGQADALGDVWGNDVVIAYVAPGGAGVTRDAARPSYGYTYTIDGMPLVEQPYQDRNVKSWIYPVTADRQPVLSGITAGYLIQNAGS